jgi:sulfatase maturation enzyme AslB (radical SAM superfamily)
MKDRARLKDGNQTCESYFCESYKQFFDYALPKFKQIAAAIEAGTAKRHTRSADRIRLKIQK